MFECHPLDFRPISWSVGRTYHNLVQSKVDQVGERSEKSKKPLCSTFNDFDTEGKWESDNPEQTCNHSHHYCEKKGNIKTNHQERFCNRKLTGDKWQGGQGQVRHVPSDSGRVFVPVRH